MTKYLFTLILLLISRLAFSQTITSNPEYPTAIEPITIYFDATGTGLEGYTGDVYAHTGVNLESGAEWQHVIGSWGNNSTQPQLTRVGTDQYTLEISPSVNDFYNVGGSEVVVQLCFVFRSSEGTQQTTDLFLDIYPVTNDVTIVQPDTNDIFSIGETVNIQAVALFADSIKIYFDDTLHTAVENTLLEVDVTALEEGKTYFKVIAKNETEADTIESFFFVRRDNVVENLPNGLKYGINYIDANTVTLVLYAPNKEFIFVKGDFNDWKISLDYQMKITPDNNVFWITLDNLTPNEEYAFQYYIDAEFSVADPYTDKILDPWNDQYISNTTYPNLKPYPDGGDGIVSVFQTEQTPYVWQNTDFERPANEDLIIYELLIRDFVVTHDYQTLIDTLDYIKNLGVNAIELMPVSEFEGNSSWGYNPSFYFAPDKYYGTKNKLKEFIDTCHQNGIAVIIDMVFNHSYGQSPLVLMYLDRTTWTVTPDNPWYNVTSPNPVYSWGYDFNHESQATVDFVDSAITYWLTEYKVDGYRFDFTKGFTNTSGDGWAYDSDRIDILKHYYDKTQEVSPDSYLILEHFSDNSEEKILAEYGMMLWGNINYSYGQASMGYQSGSDFSWVSYQERGWNVANVVGYMESHDEERMMYRNITYGNSSGTYDITELNTALERAELSSVLFFTIPGPKMIWQFEELGYDISIEYPCRVCEKPILWEYYDDFYRNRLYLVMKSLIELKKEYQVFKTDNYEIDFSSSVKEITLYGDTMDVYVVGNFDLTSKTTSLPFTDGGVWYEYFSHTEKSSASSLTLSAGDYRLYSTKKLPEPNIPQTQYAPEVSNVIIDGYTKIYNTLNVTYSYFDFNDDPEGQSIIEWYVSDYPDGADKLLIENASTDTLVLSKQDLYKYIAVKITPVAQSTELTTGNSVFSEFVGPITFTTDDITFYPNPFDDILNIVNSGDYDNIVICDIYGQKIIDEETDSKKTLSYQLDWLEEGVYLLRLTKDKKVIERKIIKLK